MPLLRLSPVLAARRDVNVGAEGDIAQLREQIASLRRDLERVEAQQRDLPGIKLDVADYTRTKASIQWLWRALIAAVVTGAVAYGFRFIGA